VQATLREVSSLAADRRPNSSFGAAFVTAPPASSGVLVDELDAGGIYPSLKTLIKFQFVLPTCNL